MASSPLTMALLSGGGGGAYGPYGMAMYDPATLGAMQRLQFAQGMVGQGLDSSPAYPAQALSRLGQALLGGLMLKRGYGDLQQLAHQRQADTLSAMDFMRDGAPSAAEPAPEPAPQQQPSAPPQASLAPIVHQLESNGSTAAGVTGDGGAAAGPMQVHQAALTDVNKAQGTNYTLDQLKADPTLGIKVGDAYLAQQQARFPGRPDLALAAYNAGPTRTAATGGDAALLPPSTQNYVNRGMTMLAGGQGGQQAQPQIGASSTPAVSDIMDRMKRIEAVAAANPYNPAIQEAARMEMQRAQLELQMGRFETIQTPYGPAKHNMFTGETTPLFTGTPRATTDIQGRTIMMSPGGGTSILTDNHSGITGNTPEANAMRIIAGIGPKIAAGTATPQERANYSTAAEFFQGFKTEVNPADQSILRVPQRSLPPGMPSPEVPFEQSTQEGQTAPHAAGEGATSATGVTPLTKGGAPVTAVDKRYESLGTLEKTALGARDELQQAQLLKQTMHELGSTGPATPFLANLSRYAEQAGVDPKTIAKFGLPPGATETQAAALANALVMEIARAGFPQRITNNDLQFAASVKPNPAQPLAAADFLIDNTIVPRAQRDIERYGSVVNLTNAKHPDYDPNLGSMNAKLYEFDQSHPLSSYTPKLQGGNQAQAQTPAPSRADVEAEMRRRGLLK